MTISFTSYSTATGNVLATRVRHSTAYAVADTVAAFDPVVASATGYTVTNSTVVAKRLHTALASAVVDIVRTRFQHQATAAAFSTLPSVSTVYTHAPPHIAHATGTMKSTGNVATLHPHFARATQVNDIVISKRGHTAYATQVAPPVNFALLVAQTPLMYSALGPPTEVLADSWEGQDSWDADFIHAIFDMLTMSDAYASITQALQSLTDKMSLKDLATLLHRANLLDSFIASAVQVGKAQITALLKDGFVMHDNLSPLAQILAVLRSSMRMVVTLNTGQDIFTAWVMTPETKAVRSYSNFPFNSFIMLGDQFLAASAAGVYQMGAETDAGTPITARVRTGLLNFNTSKLKRIDRAYLGYKSSGTLCLRVCATALTGEKVVYTYQMVPQTADAPVQGRIGVGRGIRSVYFSFELCNDADSSTFELYDAAVLPMVLTGRIV